MKFEATRRKVDTMEHIDYNHERKKFKSSISIVDLVIFFLIRSKDNILMTILNVTSITDY
jgi:hypothetical protein